MRAHASRVSALEFLPFDSDALLTAGADDDVVRLWRLPSGGAELETDLATPAAQLRLPDARHPVMGIRPHPSAADVVTVFARDQLVVLDLQSEQPAFSLPASGDATTIGAVGWNYDGSAALVATAASGGAAFQLVDPRAAASLAPFEQSTVAHDAGNRPVGVAWCGALDHFVTTGSNRMQERELKLWDPRKSDKPLHRERLLDAAGIGVLLPLYDADVNLLFLLGRGDRTARCFEVDISRAPFVHALDRAALGNATLAAALLPKRACASRSCEVARVLSLSNTSSSSATGGACDVLSYRVPRKDAAREFQRDLFPDTRADVAALRASEWLSGGNAPPVLVQVKPSDGVGGGGGGDANEAETAVAGVFGRAASANSAWGLTANAWAPPAAASSPAPAAAPAAAPTAATTATASAWATSGWNAPMASAASSSSSQASRNANTNGWRSGGTKWNEAPSAPVAMISAPAPVTWVTPPPPAPVAGGSSDGTTSAAKSATDGASDRYNDDEQDDLTALSAKAQRLGARYGHKLKYIHGTPAARGAAFNLGDKRVERSASLPVMAANASFWALPVAGPGGPVLVQPLDASGRASTSTTTTSVLNAQRAEVTALAFSPFDDSLLASGSADNTIQLWSVRRLHPGTAAGDADNVTGEPRQALAPSSAGNGVRTLSFHPTAANVLCSTGSDRSLRFWDVETAQERVCIADKLDDAAWNAAFNEDGSLLATASRDRVVRVFDPRALGSHAVTGMSCGFEGARPQFVAWLNAPHELLTVGANARGDTQLSMWDARRLLEPLAAPTTVTGVDPTSGTVCFPFYDHSSRLLLLPGVGSRHVWSYELHPETATAHANLPFALPATDGGSGLAIGGAALLPKTLCDVRNLELARLLVLTPASVERVAFSVPRADKLREFFQDDVFGPVRRRHEPLLSADQWFEGDAIPPLAYDSLCPDGAFNSPVVHGVWTRREVDRRLTWMMVHECDRDDAAVREAERGGGRIPAQDARVPGAAAARGAGGARQGRAVRAAQRTCRADTRVVALVLTLLCVWLTIEL